MSLILFCLQNREMHDHMQYFLAGDDPPPLTSTENKPEVVYRWAITSQFPFLQIFFLTSHAIVKCTSKPHNIHFLIFSLSTVKHSHQRHRPTRPSHSSKSLRSSPEAPVHKKDTVIVKKTLSMQTETKQHQIRSHECLLCQSWPSWAAATSTLNTKV